MFGATVRTGICAMAWLFLATGPLTADTRTLAVSSPHKEVQSTVWVNSQQQLRYSVRFDNYDAITDSPIGLALDNQMIGDGVTLGEPTSWITQDSYRWRGVHAVAINHCLAMTIPIHHQATGTDYTLETRTYDNGFAFRLVIPGEQKREIQAWGSTQFRLPVGSQLWFQTETGAYEGCYFRVPLEEVPQETFMGPPVTVTLPGSAGYLAITEAALFKFSGMTLRSECTPEGVMLREYFQDDYTWQMTGPITTPWRVIMVSKDLDGLVNCDIVHNLCPPPTEELAKAPWIKPGRCVWSWLGGGGVTMENMKLYSELAGKLGFEYNLVDEGWSYWKDGEKNEWDLIKELVEYSRARNVGIWVWKSCLDRERIPGIIGAAPRREFFRKCKEVGVVGVKIDFMNSESLAMIDFYESALRDAAEFGLMVNFHGANKPTGESRTWPNEMTREGIYGLERLPGWARYNTILPFTRYLAGHADYTPLSFTSRLGDTTWCHQIATTIVFTSPLLVFGEHPEVILKNPACDFIRSIPTVWDETVVLPGSDIGRVAAFARRKGSTWFVGIINGTREAGIEVTCSFLGEGKYQAEMLADVANKADILNPTRSVATHDTRILVPMRYGGGWAAKFVPVDQSW